MLICCISSLPFDRNASLRVSAKLGPGRALKRHSTLQRQITNTKPSRHISVIQSFYGNGPSRTVYDHPTIRGPLARILLRVANNPSYTKPAFRCTYSICLDFVGEMLYFVCCANTNHFPFSPSLCPQIVIDIHNTTSVCSKRRVFMTI